MARRPLLARFADALTALSGEPVAAPSVAIVPSEPKRLMEAPVMDGPAPAAAAEGTRATVGNGAEFLNGSGMGGIAQVRTANPQEYKYNGATIRAQGFNKHPVVAACFRAIVDQVAQIPLVVMDGDGKNAKRVGPNDRLQMLLDKPGRRLTARQLRSRIALDTLGYGNCVLWLERVSPARGKPLGIRPLNPEAVQTVWVDDAGDAVLWDISNWNGRVLRIPYVDLLHFKDLDMPRPFTPDVFGYPRGAAAIESIIADREATSYVRQVVTNDGTPTFVALLNDGVQQTDAIALKERYMQRIVARGKRGSPEFFAGVKDVKALGFTLSELEFPDLRRVSREDICSVYGVDPRMIGSSSAANDGGLSGQQYQEARSRLIQHTVEPLLGLIVDELNASLSPEFGNVVIDYDRDVLRDLVEDDKATSERVRAEVAVPGLRTLQEARAALKLPAQAPITDTILLPFGTQLVPVAAAVIDPSDIEDPAETEAAKGDGSSVGDAGDETTDKPRALPRAMRTNVDPQFAHWRRQIELLDADEVHYAANARQQFRDDAESVAKIFADVAASTGRAVNDPDRARAVAQATSQYKVGGKYHDEWRKRFESLIAKTYRTGTAADVVGTAVLDFQLPNPFVQQAVERRATLLATYVGESTARQITAVSLAAERAGMSIAETGRLIQQAVYGQHITDTRARVIARTESAGAMSQGQWDQADQSGVYQSKGWLAFDDNETRETHRQCHAEGRIPIHQAFAANRMQYPMEPGAPAAEVIQCRCRPIFYVEAAHEAVQ